MRDHEDTNDDDDVPMSPLLEGGNGKQKSHRVGFWKKIFKKSTNEDGNDEPKEDLGLLSAPDLESADDMPTLLSEPTHHRTGNINDDDSESDEEEDQLMQPPSHRCLQEDGDEAEEEGHDFLLLDSGMSSDEENENSDGEDNDESSGSDDSGSDDSKNSESGDEEDSHEERDQHDSDALKQMETIPYRPFFQRSLSSGKQMETKPHRPFFQRSLSSSSGYSDNTSGYSDNAYSDQRVDSTDRKRVNDRIQGFGNAAAARQPLPEEDVTSPQTIREKIRAFRENRTKKMDIGRTSWQAKVEEFVVDIVDKTLPPEPPVFHIDRSRFNSEDSMPEDKGESTRRSSSDNASIVTDRRAFADNNAYILYLERELRTKDLEIASWKNRSEDLQREVNRLTGVADDSSVASDTSVHDQGESEIEWQTGGVAEEGILIDVGTPPVDSQPSWASQEGDHKASAGDEKVSETPIDPKPNPLGRESDERVSAPSDIKKTAILLKPPPAAPQRPEDDEFQWYSAVGVLVDIEDSSPIRETESEETPSNGDKSHEDDGAQGQPVNLFAMNNTNDASEESEGQPELRDRNGDCEKESPTEVAQVEPQDNALSNDTEIKDQNEDESSEEDGAESSEEDEDEDESSEEDEDDEGVSDEENGPKEGDLLELGDESKASHSVAGATIGDVGQETPIVSDEDDAGDSSSEDRSTESLSARVKDEEAIAMEGNLLDLDDDGGITASPQNPSDGNLASVLPPSVPYVR